MFDLPMLQKTLRSVAILVVVKVVMVTDRF